MWFWMPARETVFDQYTDLERKQTPAGFYIMWCRCDFCGWSGPSEQFEFVWRRGDIKACHVCDKCMKLPEVLSFLDTFHWRIS